MRTMCYRCNWPQQHCWCGSIAPMATRTKFVFLLHPYEFKRVKANTGRLTHLSLADSELHMGIGFDEHERVQEILADPGHHCVLLYPGRTALDLSELGAGSGGLGATGDGAALEALRGQLETQRLVVFLLDGTWRTVRPMLRTSLSLQRLPQVMFSAAAPSRYVIKRQPKPGCLSTLEATHELLVALDRAGLDRYERPLQLLDLFQRMQDFQLACIAENRRRGWCRHGRRHAIEVPSGAGAPEA
jgi:DTW domain-containing protein YfiP